MNKHKYLATVIALVVALALSGCGNSSVDVEAIGQPKKLHRVTPVICGDYDMLDLSLGIMQNGVGSMSTQDLHTQLADDSMKKTAAKAVDSGYLVKVRYDERRLVFCGEEARATAIEIVRPQGQSKATAQAPSDPQHSREAWIRDSTAAVDSVLRSLRGNRGL